MVFLAGFVRGGILVISISRLFCLFTFLFGMASYSSFASVKKILPPPSGKDFDEAVQFLGWINDLKNPKGMLRQNIYASLKQPDTFRYKISNSRLN